MAQVAADGEGHQEEVGPPQELLVVVGWQLLAALPDGLEGEGAGPRLDRLKGLQAEGKVQQRGSRA